MVRKESKSLQKNLNKRLQNQESQSPSSEDTDTDSDESSDHSLENVEPIKVYHTTANYGKIVPGHTPLKDLDINLHALWTMICIDSNSEFQSDQTEQANPCCRHHNRLISLPDQVFEDWANDDDNQESDVVEDSKSLNVKSNKSTKTVTTQWNKAKKSTKASSLKLNSSPGQSDSTIESRRSNSKSGVNNETTWSMYWVNERPGANENHKFYKYVLCMDRDQKRTLEKCKDWKGYGVAFNRVKTKNLMKELAKFYNENFSQDIIDEYNEDSDDDDDSESDSEQAHNSNESSESVSESGSNHNELASESEHDAEKVVPIVKSEPVKSEEKPKIQKVWHMHLGILGVSPFDSYIDENPNDWLHLKPEKPEIHKSKNMKKNLSQVNQNDENDNDWTIHDDISGRDSDSESDSGLNSNRNANSNSNLDDDEQSSDHDDSDVNSVTSMTQSEIGRKYGGGDDGWETKKSKKKAKEGCLPFCFESDTNIFPDCDGVFRHYCRAEAIWACRRKLCVMDPSRGAGLIPKEWTKDLTQKHGGVPTRWFSANCWYHEHLKDVSTQGLRKGFEKQYCNVCARKYNNKSNNYKIKESEWVEGKIIRFDKPGADSIFESYGVNGRKLASAGSGSGPHDEKNCEVCIRLKEKGFEGSCNKFSDFKSRGFILVKEGSTDWIWANSSLISSIEEAEAAIWAEKKWNKGSGGGVNDDSIGLNRGLKQGQGQGGKKKFKGKN